MQNPNDTNFADINQTLKVLIEITKEISTKLDKLDEIIELIDDIDTRLSNIEPDDADELEDDELEEEELEMA